MTDPISDMLTRIRNAIAVNRQFVNVPFSKHKAQIAQQLASAGFILKVETVDGSNGFKELKIALREVDSPAKITVIERMSKPGRRLYASASDMKPVLGGRGMVIVSTSEGVMTDFEARKRRIGGELICKVY
jgi:small subunit ribosomal protein S8